MWMELYRNLARRDQKPEGISSSKTESTHNDDRPLCSMRSSEIPLMKLLEVKGQKSFLLSNASLKETADLIHRNKCFPSPCGAIDLSRL